ncbi:site-specific integrase [Rhodococcus sp. Z13]|uniref:Site-specific integrase n=1 Tax=Rhodococcus sacchari TaxID=2962047 RepID=A0ACD4DCN4_9NOCA|nr:site-specific integrase [Rhodococcus sp. Z13]UYP17767.1 site-specific integrase [Rhodococcus sp. Z13]
MGRPPLPIGAHGKIARTQLPDGRWRASCRVRDFDGVTRKVYRETPFGQRDRTGAVAERYLLEALAERSTPQDGDITADTKVRVLWPEYRKKLVTAGRAASTLVNYDRIAARIVDGLGELKIREATTPRLEKFVHEMADRHGVPTAKNARTILLGMFKLAVRYGALTVNPVREVTTPPRKGPRRTARAMDAATLAKLLRDVHESTVPCPPCPTPAERRKIKGVLHRRVPTVAEFCAATDTADVVVLFAATGCRIGELLGIRWKDVDLDEKVVHITGKIVRITGKGLIREDMTKTPAGMRTLPLPDFAVAMLQRRAQIGPLVFESLNGGGPRHPTTVSRQWLQIRSALGLDWVTTHTFRKTVATLIDEEGLSARVAADQLGHAQVSMTTDTYFGRGRTHAAVAEVLEGVLGGDIRYVSGTSGPSNDDGEPAA